MPSLTLGELTGRGGEDRLVSVRGDPAVLSGRSFALIASRQSRGPSSSTPWVRAMRAAGEMLPEHAVVIGSVGELPYEVGRAVARARGLRVVDVLRAPLGAECSDAALTISMAGGPALRGPERDELVLTLADVAVAVAVRPGGSFVRRFEALARTSPDRAWAVDGARVGLDARVARGLEALGCRLVDVSEPPIVQKPAERLAPFTRVSFAEAAKAADWPFLTHFTRAPRGPWAGESLRAYAERLARGEVFETSAEDTLARIVASRRLLACSARLRGGPAVCFTERRPHELMALKRHHRSLGRPRYEPFGIAVPREALEQLGARPVCYGDEAVWASLPDEERWRFQHVGRTERWTEEREWRFPRDLELSRLDPDSVRLVLP
ncbi:MAG: hypothetical protein HYV07_29625 [Deltaproteobacteria bacterium]|nr:hypothetical protein [Deltaproteobacteria bacterium]